MIELSPISMFNKVHGRYSSSSGSFVEDAPMRDDERARVPREAVLRESLCADSSHQWTRRIAGAPPPRPPSPSSSRAIESCTIIDRLDDKGPRVCAILSQRPRGSGTSHSVELSSFEWRKPGHSLRCSPAAASPASHPSGPKASRRSCETAHQLHNIERET